MRKELFQPVASQLMAHLATQWTFVKDLGRTVAKDLRCVFWKLAHYCPHEATETDIHEEGYGWARVGHCRGEWTSELSVLKRTVTFAFWNLASCIRTPWEPIGCP